MAKFLGHGWALGRNRSDDRDLEPDDQFRTRRYDYIRPFARRGQEYERWDKMPWTEQRTQCDIRGNPKIDPGYSRNLV